MSNRWLLLIAFMAVVAGVSIAGVIILLVPPESDYPRHSFWPSYVSISSDGNYIAAVYSEKGDVMLFGRGDNTPLWNTTVEGTFGGHDITESISISSDGSYIAVGGRGHIYLFSKDNATPLWSAGVVANLVAISANGNYVITAQEFGPFHLFSKDDASPLWSFTSPKGSTNFSISISSDGSYVAANVKDELYMFGRESSTPLWTFTPGESLLSPSISSNGDHLAVGGDGLYLFDQGDNVPLWVYRGDGMRPVISGDGNYIAAAVSGGATYLGEPDGGELYLFSRTENIPIWNTSYPCLDPKVVISSNGEFIIVGEYYGKLSIFSRESSTPLWTYQFPKNIWVSSVSMSADGQYIAVGTGGIPGPNIATSIYLFSKDSSTPLWVYYHEVGPYGYA